MLKSMTGFGKCARTIGLGNVTVEVRALNSKYLDLNLKLPSAYKDKEHALRKSLIESLIRGKIEMQMEVDNEEPLIQRINKKIFREYHIELNSLAEEFGLTKNNLFDLIMKMPDILVLEERPGTEEEWAELFSVIKSAVAQLDEYRIIEGAQLEKDMQQRIISIKKTKGEIEKIEKGRPKKIRERIEEGLEHMKGMVNFDESRLEHEMIFYLEKLDITEELVRLQSHCDFFQEIMDDRTSATNGKKLAFVSQEIGREINTIGSKAYDAQIQRLVVQMKDELEKIKEQINNIL